MGPLIFQLGSLIPTKRDKEEKGTYLIIGSKEFVSTRYKRFQHLFATKIKKLPKPVKGLSGMYSQKRLSEIL